MTPKSDDEVRLNLIELYNINPDIFDFLNDNGYKFVMAHETTFRDRWRITIEFRNEKEKHSVYFLPSETLDVIRKRVKGFFVTESIRDKMTPISSESITKNLGNLTGYKLMNYLSDVILQDDGEWIITVLKHSDLTQISETDIVNLFELAIDTENITTIQYFLDRGLSKMALDYLHTYSVDQQLPKISDIN